LGRCKYQIGKKNMHVAVKCVDDIAIGPLLNLIFFFCFHLICLSFSHFLFN
jgi:hypothetical protein